MRKQTIFVITAAILLTAIVSVVLYNVKTTNAQGNMSSVSGANMTKGSMSSVSGANMTQGNITAAGAAKNMTSAMSTVAKAMNKTK
jgi:hypothetical protein